MGVVMIEFDHGGADALGQAPWDFSSNANALGPCPQTLQTVQTADVGHYPDPRYQALKAVLADFHGVEVWRIVIAASASEFIQRCVALHWREGRRCYWVPDHAYGDYERAASVWGMTRTRCLAKADLIWVSDPTSPLGVSESECVMQQMQSLCQGTVVLDTAYEPLRLSGKSAWQTSHREKIWQLVSPNKALGMTGVRAAYAIAPVQSQAMVNDLEQMAPSWPIGTQGVAMLQSWTQAATQNWVNECLPILREWGEDVRQQLVLEGWQCRETQTHYFCAKPPDELDTDVLRRHGVKLRDATSFGLPGWWRLSAQSPRTVQVLIKALRLSAPDNGAHLKLTSC
jgi:histidinol-phosphate aminotransferase